MTLIRRASDAVVTQWPWRAEAEGPSRQAGLGRAPGPGGADARRSGRDDRRLEPARRRAVSLLQKFCLTPAIPRSMIATIGIDGRDEPTKARRFTVEPEAAHDPKEA
jgi:hypothetical protein